MKVILFVYIYIMTLSSHMFQSFAKRFHSYPHIQKHRLGFIKDISCRPDIFSSLPIQRYPMNHVIHTKKNKSRKTCNINAIHFNINDVWANLHYQTTLTHFTDACGDDHLNTFCYSNLF